jgi:hypothetical protein
MALSTRPFDAEKETYAMHIESTGGSAVPFSVARPIHPTVGSANAHSAGCNGEEDHIPAQLTAVMAENRELRAELERLRSERNQLAETQARVMELLGTKSADRLVHDLRNVLNERELYRALADSST